MTVPTELTPGAIAGAIARMQPVRAPLRVVRPAVAAALVLELVGPAGAGKSTVRERVLSLLDDDAPAPHVRDVDRRRLRTAALALAHAPAWAPAAAALLGASPGEARRLLRHLVRVHTLRAELPRLRAGAGRALVLDEGPVFSLVRLAGASGADRDALARYLRAETFAWASCLDTVVWLDASDAVLTRRIRERAKAHRVKDHSDVEIREFLRAYRCDFERVVGELAALRVRVVRVDTTREPVGTIAERVRAVIDGGARAR